MSADESIIYMSMQDLKALVVESVREVMLENSITSAEVAAGSAASGSGGPEFVYGLRGLMELFGISKSAAQNYKRTFLAPAITQNGKGCGFKTDVEMAKTLYAEHRSPVFLKK